MIDVSQSIKSLYRSDVIPHTIRFTIGETAYTETDIVSGSLSIQESICSKDTLQYNSVEAAKLELTLAKETGNIAELTGKELTIFADVNNTSTSIPLGVFTISEAKLDGDYFTNIVAYNRMQVFLDTIIDSWWNERVEFPITIRQLLAELCVEINVPYSLPSSWTNSELLVNRNVFFDQGTAAELLGYIQEASGAFFVVDRSGTLKMLEPSEETTTFTYEMLFSDAEIADYENPSIERLWLHATDDDVGVTVGSGSNTYTITANPLLFDNGTDDLTVIATNILNAIQRNAYIPFKASVKCQPYLEVGDPVTVRTYKGNQASFVLMHRKMSDVGLLVDDIEVKGKAEIKQRTSTSKQVKVLNRKMHEVVNTIESFSSRISNVKSEIDEELENYVTTTELATAIDQSAESIQLSVINAINGEELNMHFLFDDQGVHIATIDGNGDIVSDYQSLFTQQGLKVMNKDGEETLIAEKDTVDTNNLTAHNRLRVKEDNQRTISRFQGFYNAIHRKDQQGIFWEKWKENE